MERINKVENVTEYYIDDRLLLTITELGNDNYIVENNSFKLEGNCKNIDDNKTQVTLTGYYSKGKNGRLYKTKKLLEHNVSWLSYILQEKGFIQKTLPIQ